MAQPNLGAHNHPTDSDEEDIPVAHAFAPGGQNIQYSQPPSAAAQPYSGPQQVYEARPFPSYPYDAGKVPVTPPNYNGGGKPVAAGAVAADPPAKCLGLPKKLFFILLALVVLIAGGLAVGVGVAVSSGGKGDKGSGKTSPGQSPATPSSPVSNSPSTPSDPGASIPVVTTKPSSPSSGTTPNAVTQAPSLPGTGIPSATVKPSSPTSTTAAPKTSAAPTTGASPTPTLFSGSGTLTSDGRDMVTAINSIRQQNGLDILQVDSTLVCVAQQLSETKGGQANPTCDSQGYPLQTRATQCKAAFDTVNQLTGCEYLLADNQVNSWATDSKLSGVLFDPTWSYVGADGYPNERFWTAVFA